MIVFCFVLRLVFMVVLLHIVGLEWECATVMSTRFGKGTQQFSKVEEKEPQQIVKKSGGANYGH